MGVKILGTSAENVDAAEDRELFDEILEKCQIPRPKGHTVFTAEEAKKAANELGYPVLVRPSYVLGGQGMRIAVSDEDVEEYIGVINQIAQEHPILVDKYLMGKEIEVDAVCDGEDILIPGIMEHIERAGIHSGDSISVYPARTISEKAKETIAEYTRRLARALHVVGMINIQFIVLGMMYMKTRLIHVPAVPYLTSAKFPGIPIEPLATKVILGYKLKDMGMSLVYSQMQNTLPSRCRYSPSRRISDRGSIRRELRPFAAVHRNKRLWDGGNGRPQEQQD